MRRKAVVRKRILSGDRELIDSWKGVYGEGDSQRWSVQDLI